MKKYRVGFYYTVYGVVRVKAESEKEAQEKIDNELAEKGLELDYDEKDREYKATFSELTN